MKMVVFSDIHYLDRKYEGNGNRKLTEYSLELLDKLIKKINDEIMPDVCINLGDLVQDTKNKEADLKNLKLIWKKLQQFKVPFYTLIGNHDLKMMDNRKEVLDILGYERGTFSVDIQGYHMVFIGLDINKDCDLNNGGINRTRKISELDLNWIEEDLKNNKHKKCIVFSHFGIAEDDMIGNFWFEKDSDKAVFENRDRIKQILKKHDNVIAVFSGHQHWTKHIKENEIDYYIVGSLIENIQNNDIPDGVYLEVDIEDNKVNVIEHHLNI